MAFSFGGVSYTGSGIAAPSGYSSDGVWATRTAPRPAVAAAPAPVAPNVNGYRPGDAQLANQANRSTKNYQAELKARFDKLMGMAQQFGAAQTAQSNQLMTQQMAAGQSSLVDRGLGNSTVVDAVNQNAQDLNQRRLLDINERSNAMQMGVVQDQVPQAPDMQLLASLFGAQRTGGAPLASSLPLFRMFSQPPAKGRVAA